MLCMSLLPCHRYFPAGVSSRTNQSSITHAAFAQTLKARPPEFPPFEVTLRSLALRPGSSLAIPRTALSMGFNRFGFPYGCHPSYGSLVPFPAGLTPAEHACLIWTHNVLADSTASATADTSTQTNPTELPFSSSIIFVSTLVSSKGAMHRPRLRPLGIARSDSFGGIGGGSRRGLEARRL